MGAAAQRLPAILRQRLRWISLTPFDQSTAQGRADERHRRVALTALAAALAKILSVGTALISVPLTLHYLGSERFGMWMTISSLIAMLSFADFGIANGVLSAVAAAHGKDDDAGVRRASSSGFFLLAGIGLSIAGLFGIAYAFVPWHLLFNVQGELARAEAAPALAVFVICFAIAIPLGVVQRVQMGLQQGFVASVWQCVGSVCALGGIILAIKAHAGLTWLVLAMTGAPLLALALNSVHFYGSVRPDLRPRITNFSRAEAKVVAGTGALFFILQLAVAVAYTSDNLVIAHLLGAKAVADYAVPEKLFSLITLGLGMILSPLWPAYGEAISRQDRDWVRRTFKRSLILVFCVASVASMTVFALAPNILHLWVGTAVTTPVDLLLAFAIWKIIEACGNAVAVFLNGAKVISLQIVVASATAVAALILKFTFIPQIGISGAVLATLLAYLVFAGLPYAIYVPRLSQLK